MLFFRKRSLIGFPHKTNFFFLSFFTMATSFALIEKLLMFHDKSEFQVIPRGREHMFECFKSVFGTHNWHLIILNVSTGTS